MEIYVLLIIAIALSAIEFTLIEIKYELKKKNELQKELLNYYHTLL